MKIIHHRDEFGDPQTTKAIREGIFWNDLCGNWSVHPEWGHAQCSSISQAKRTFKSKFTGKYKTLENGQKFPIFQYPEKLVGGHKHNVYYNTVLKTLVTSKNTRKQLKRKYKKIIHHHLHHFERAFKCRQKNCLKSRTPSCKKSEIP